MICIICSNMFLRRFKTNKCFQPPQCWCLSTPPRPLKRHTISKCRAIFSRNPFPSHQFHISCRPHRPTQHLVLQLPGQENCIFGRCHQLAQASKHHPRTSQRTKGWCGPAEGEKTTGLFPKEAAIMDTVFMFILEIKFSPKFTCSQTKSKWMPPRRFFSSWARSSGHPLQVPKILSKSGGGTTPCVHDESNVNVISRRWFDFLFNETTTPKV